MSVQTLNVTYPRIDRCKPWMRCQLWVLFQLDTQASISPPASQVRTGQTGWKRWDESRWNALVMMMMCVGVLCVCRCERLPSTPPPFFIFLVPALWTRGCSRFQYPVRSHYVHGGERKGMNERWEDKETDRPQRDQSKWAGRGKKGGLCRSSASLYSFPRNQLQLSRTSIYQNDLKCSCVYSWSLLIKFKRMLPVTGPSCQHSGCNKILLGAP